MYRSFTVKNFRCFQEMKIDGFERINLVTGKNNVGKTALLEALWVYHGYQNPILGVNIDKFRGLDTFRKDDFLRNMFFGFDAGEPIQLSAVDMNGQMSTLHIRVGQRSVSSLPIEKVQNGETDEDANAVEVLSQETTEAVDPEVVYQIIDSSGSRVSARAFFEGTNISVKQVAKGAKSTGIFLAARTAHNYGVIAERLSNLAVEKMEGVIVNALQIVEPHLLSLRVQYRGGVPLIYGDIGSKRLIPFPLMGDGMSRLLGIALAITDARDGILLIDEIENGIHHSVMGKLWKTLSALAQTHNVQIFATTHSMECVHAAYEAFEPKESYDFSLYRLEHLKTGIKAVRYNKETLEAAVETDLEVR